MPTLAKFDGIKVQDFADHNPPHFHVVFAEYEVLVAIPGLDVLQGSMPRSQLERALGWARAHMRDIEDEWTRING
jgi:hypothetical protein